jgi:hypothetical protein
MQQKSCTSSMNMQHGDMDIHQPLCNTTGIIHKQHEHAFWRHGHASWTRCMDMQHEQAACTCILETWTYITDVQQGQTACQNPPLFYITAGKNLSFHYVAKSKKFPLCNIAVIQKYFGALKTRRSIIQSPVRTRRYIICVESNLAAV